MKFALICFGNEESYGLLFVGAELVHQSHQVRYFDAEHDKVVKATIHWSPDFVLFSPMTTFQPWALSIAKKIKREMPDITTVWGGHHATADPTIIEEKAIDMVVVGPAKGALEQIISKKQGIVRAEPTSPADLPLPDREGYFRDIPRMAQRYRKIMLSTLGCPWNCAYCSSAAGHRSKIFGAKAHTQFYLTKRPLAAILEEAQFLLKYNTAEIEWVDDDMFFGENIDDWIQELVGLWVRKIGLPMYVSTTSANALKIADQTLAALRKIVNCIGLGVQAIRPESLKLLNRSWDSERQMKQAYDRLASFGFSVNLQAIVGLPIPDPVQDAVETLQGLQRIGPGSICSIYPLMIYPNTKMEAYIHRRGFKLNPECNGDTNSAIPHILFEPDVVKKLRNICKLGTFFVKYNVDENWMRALLDVDFNDLASKQLSTVRYYDCVKDRLKEKGERIFNEIMRTSRLRY